MGVGRYSMVMLHIYRMKHDIYDDRRTERWISDDGGAESTVERQGRQSERKPLVGLCVNRRQSKHSVMGEQGTLSML